MKSFISLLNTVLALGLLVAGCGPASTPTPPAEVPISVLTREEAIERLMAEVIQPSPNADMLVAYGLQQSLSASDVLQSILPADIESSTALIGPPYSHGEAWFFWIDDQPQAAYAHSTRFVLIDRATGAIKIMPEEWWPVINGEPYWDSLETREGNADIVYQGVQAYANPEASDWSVQFVTNRVTLPLRADKPKYAILVRGSDERAINNSFEAMKDQLMREGFPRDNIIGVSAYSPDVKKEKLLKAFGDMVSKIKADGAKSPEFLFYYVGHGRKDAMVFSNKKHQQTGAMEYNTPSKSVLNSDGSIITDTLAGNLLLIPSENVTVIIDNCKSGTAIKALSGIGLKGRILTATDEDGKMLYWHLGRTDYTAYLLDGRQKHGSFWWGHDHAAYQTARYWYYKDPKPQKKELDGTFGGAGINGTVRDKNTNKEISKATITITGINVKGTKKITYTITTDESGKYKIEKLPWWGTFTFKVTVKGYKPYYSIKGIDGQFSGLDLLLEPEPPTPTPTPTLTPEKVVTPTPTPTITPTPTPTPTPKPEKVVTPAPTAEDYVEECNAHLGRAKEYLAVHDCGQGIPELWKAIEKSTNALELDPNNFEACGCRGLSFLYLEDLDKAILDLECALEGLKGEKKVEVEKELGELKRRVGTPTSMSMGPVAFGTGLTEDGQLIGLGNEFPADTLKEIYAKWDVEKADNKLTTIKWFHNFEMICYHFSQLEPNQNWDGTMFFPDEGGYLQSGPWGVEVWIGNRKMTEGYCDFK